MDRPVFRENLIMFCEARKLSGAESARLSGVDYQVVQNLLARRTIEPKISDAIALARLFNLTVEEMMSSAEAPAAPMAADEHYTKVLETVCNLDHDDRQRLWADLKARGESFDAGRSSPAPQSSLAPGEHVETYRIPSRDEVEEMMPSRVEEQFS